MKILVLEDEIVVAQALKQSLKKLGHDSVVICNNCEDAETALKIEQPDIAIIDIQIHGELKGLEFAAYCNNLSVSFIFITALSDINTMSRATNLSPITYLNKPYKESELQAAIMLSLAKSKKDEIIHLVDGKKKYRIPLSNLLFLEADTPYVKIHCEDSIITVRNSISRLQKLSNCDALVRIHKSFAVNKNKIQAQGINYVVINNTKLPLSNVYKTST